MLIKSIYLVAVVATVAATFGPDTIQVPAFPGCTSATIDLCLDASGRPPAQVAILVDQSGSMGNTQTALNNNLASLSTTIIGNGGQVAIVPFEATPSFGPNNIFTTDNSVLSAALGYPLFGGEENFENAVQGACDNLAWDPANFEGIIVLVSDEPGDDNGDFPATNSGSCYGDKKIIYIALEGSNSAALTNLAAVKLTTSDPSTVVQEIEDGLALIDRTISFDISGCVDIFDDASDFADILVEGSTTPYTDSITVDPACGPNGCLFDVDDDGNGHCPVKILVDGIEVHEIDVVYPCNPPVLNPNGPECRWVQDIDGELHLFTRESGVMGCETDEECMLYTNPASYCMADGTCHGCDDWEGCCDLLPPPPIGPNDPSVVNPNDPDCRQAYVGEDGELHLVTRESGVMGCETDEECQTYTSSASYCMADGTCHGCDDWEGCCDDPTPSAPPAEILCGSFPAEIQDAVCQIALGDCSYCNNGYACKVC